ncbi:transcriptional protein SWT1-like isoform X2 [Branchiostoma lanceolatum]|uniref:transcriptional protein SWT1-like isoform X2 n=1 Tax=Branchiostoma lanceolatum TaxID=7740 RepID=UPI0034552BC6
MSTVSSTKTPLPLGWVKCHSKSHPGYCYYFNMSTRARTWQRPVLDEEEAKGPKEAEKKETRKSHDSGVHSDREDKSPTNDAASCVSMTSLTSEKVSHYFSSMLDKKAGPSSAVSPSEAPSERGQKRKIEDDFSDNESMLSLSAFSMSSLLSLKSKKDAPAAQKWKPLDQTSPHNDVDYGQPSETAAAATTSAGQQSQAGSDPKTGTGLKKLSTKGLTLKKLPPKISTVSRPPRSPSLTTRSPNQQQRTANTAVSPSPVRKEGPSNASSTSVDNGLDPLPDYDEVEGYTAPAPGKAKHKRMKASLPSHDLRNNITGKPVELVKTNKYSYNRGPASYVRNKLKERDLREKLTSKSMPPPMGPPSHFARPKAPRQDGVFKAPFPVGHRQQKPYYRGQSWRDHNGNHNNQEDYYTLGQLPFSLEVTTVNRTDENWGDSLTVCESPKFRSGDIDKVTCTVDQRDHRRVALDGETNAALGRDTSLPQENNAVPQENFDDIVEMDIDMDVETEERLINEIQEVRGHLSTDASASHGTLTSMQVVQTEYMETETTGAPGVDGNLPLFIVLDTNVLLNHLKFLDDLKDQQISGMGRPVLVVPWVVMQELDALKSQDMLNKPGRTLKLETQHQAAQAVRYLYKCLQNRHPRVRGQTAQEGSVKLVGFNPECNDDRVLQCCLMYSQKYTGVNVILFTNDKNLCNKAVINGMQSFTRETLMSGIKAMYPEEVVAAPIVTRPKNPIAVPVKQESRNQIRSPCVSPPMAPPNRATTPPMPPPARTNQTRGTDPTSRRKQMADDVLCGMKTLLKAVFAVVLETEMKAVYDDTWKMIVYRKPPWSLQDLLLCFDKHWIAVFGMFLSRDVKEHLDSLVKHFTRGRSYGVDLQETLQLLQDALQLVRQLHNHSTYDGTLPKVISELQTAQHQCQEVLSGNMSCLTVKQPVPPTTAPLHAPQQQEPTNSPDVQMWITFDVVWKAVSYFLVKIFNGLDYKHSIPQPAENMADLPSKYEAVTFMCKLHPLLARVVLDMENFLKLERAEQLQPLSTSLCNAIHDFLNQLVYTNSEPSSLQYPTVVQPSVLTPDVLIRYCRDPLAQERMGRGLQQLGTYLTQLIQCGNFIFPEASKNNWLQQA